MQTRIQHVNIIIFLTLSPCFSHISAYELLVQELSADRHLTTARRRRPRVRPPPEGALKCIIDDVGGPSVIILSNCVLVLQSPAHFINRKSSARGPRILSC